MRSVQPSRFLLAVALGVVLLGCSMAIVGAISTGISVDEPAHVKRVEKYLKNGKYALPREVREVRITYGNSTLPDRAYVYGPATALLQHSANRLAGNDEALRVSRSADAYAVRHLVVALIGILGLIATGFIAGTILDDWRWGVVASAMLAAVPMWTGHSMFNPKDISVATGHTVATFGFMLLASGRARANWRWLPVAGAVLTAGTVLAVGTRPAIWVSITAGGIVFLAAVIWARFLRWGTVVTLAASVVASFFILFAIYPRVFSNPSLMLWVSAHVSSDFVHLHGPKSTRAYIFAHMAQEWPLVILALLLVGTVAAFIYGIRGLREQRSVVPSALLIVGSQAFALPVLAVARDSALYNGLRQLLFAVPAQVVLATVGLATLSGWASSRRARIAVAVVASLGLALPIAAQAAMFPYQYSTINVAAQALGVRADTDYWDTSFRALSPDVPETLKVLCPHFPEPTYWKRVRADCRVKEGGTFTPFWQASERPALDVPRGNEYNALARGTLQAPRFCRTIHRLTRWQNYQRITIGRVEHCDPPESRLNTVQYDVVNPWDPGWKGSTYSAVID